MAEIVLKRTTTLNHPPASLLQGELAAGINDTPPRLWIGTPSGVKEILAGGAGIIVAPTAPPNPDENQLWWNSTDGNLYLWYDDGTSTQWTGLTASEGRRGPQGPRGVVGPTGEKGDKGDTGEVEEAPEDGEAYVRQDATWQQITIKAPTTQRLTIGTNATYTTPAGCKWIEVNMVGGGGGGAGSTAGSVGALVAGSNGSASWFGDVSANPGLGANGAMAANVLSIGSGGTGGVGAATRRQAGEDGGIGMIHSSSVSLGNRGGNSVLGRGSVVTGFIASAPPALPNTGGGGSGSIGGTATNVGGGGGGAGEYVYLIIEDPDQTYTYTIGQGGGGGAGTQVYGGNGGSGLIFVVEHYG